MRIGEKIKYYRIKKGLTQKELGLLVDLNDVRIREYEMGRRVPKDDLLDRIAKALDVSKYAISNPHLGNEVGVMHTLFELEENYGITGFQVYPNSILGEFIQEWNIKKQECKDGKITNKEYDEWKAKFPQFDKRKE